MAHRKALRSGRSRQGGSSASVGGAMSGAVIIARLIGHDKAQAGDIVARSRSPVNVSWCRQVRTSLARCGWASICCRLSITDQ